MVPATSGSNKSSLVLLSDYYGAPTRDLARTQARALTALTVSQPLTFRFEGQLSTNRATEDSADTKYALDLVLGRS